MSKSLTIIWQYLRAFVLIYACLYAGIFIASLLPIVIPGSIIGMLILFVLLAFAALPALAVTDGELLSVEIVESAMPDALPAAGISGAVVGNAAEPTGEERTSSEWPELDAVKALSADSIEQIEWIAYTEGGAQRTVITDRTTSLVLSGML